MLDFDLPDSFDPLEASLRETIKRMPEKYRSYYTENFKRAFYTERTLRNNLGEELVISFCGNGAGKRFGVYDLHGEGLFPHNVQHARNKGEENNQHELR